LSHKSLQRKEKKKRKRKRKRSNEGGDHSLGVRRWPNFNHTLGVRRLSATP
jgi:hypothetical protein